MKKFLIFILFLVLGGIIFFQGWTQIKVSPDCIGIMQSKTNGISKTPIIPGKFSWNWQFVIPKNANLVQFKPKPYNATKTISASIPQYVETAGFSDPLSYSFTYSISFSYTPDALISLYEQNKISTDQDLQSYLDNAADYIAQKATAFYISKAQSDPTFIPESLKREEIISLINAYKEFPELDITIFALTTYKMPNFALYDLIQTQAYDKKN